MIKSTRPLPALPFPHLFSRVGGSLGTRLAVWPILIYEFMANDSHILLSSTDPKASVLEDRDTITSPVYSKLLCCIKRDVHLTVIH